MLKLKKEPKTVKFEDLDKRLRRKIASDGLLFMFASIVVLLFAFQTKTIETLWLAFLLLVVGLMFVYRIYYLATRGKITKIEGMIIEIETSGYRKQLKKLHVQDYEGVVYNLSVSGYKYSFRVANEVVFFVENAALEDNRFFDGEYVIGTPLYFEITNAKVTK